MAIAFACPSCKARFEVDDSLGGKKCKCTRCGSQFIVPAKAAAAVAKKPVPPPAVEEEAPRKRSRAADDDDDRPRAKSRRDDDEEDEDRSRVKRRKDDDDDDRPRSKRSRDGDEDEDDRSRSKRRKDDDDDEDDRPRSKRRKDDDDEDEDRPRRKYHDDDEDEDRPRSRSRRRGGSKKMLFVIIGAAAFVCLALGAGLLWYLWPSGPGADIKYLPDNSQLIAKVQVQDLLDSKAYKKLTDEFGDPMKKMGGPMGDMEKETGLSVKDIDSVLIGGEITGGKENFIVVLRTTKAVTESDLFKGGKFTDTKVGKVTMHEKGDMAFCLPESKLVVLGPPETLKKVLKRDKDPELSSSMKAAIKETDFSKTIAMAMSLKDVAPKGGGKGGGAGNFGGFMGGLGAADDMAQGAEGMALTVSVKSDISAKVSVIFKDSKSATDAKQSADAAMTLMKKSKDVPSEVRDLIDAVTFKSSGNRLDISASVDVSKLIKIAKSSGVGGGNMHR